MGRNKEIHRKAREEVIAILGDQPEDVLPTVEETKQMKYLDAIIKEVCKLILNSIGATLRINNYL